MTAPFLKWAGGKRYLQETILRELPEKINTYYEPFVGGGAIFFALAKEKRFKKAKLSDINQDLILTYRAVRDNVKDVIEALQQLEQRHKKALADHGSADTVYYQIRNVSDTELPVLVTAARMIYLNKTGFNGLYRVNKMGRFNVPYGQYKNPTICNVKVLTEASECLQDVQLTIEDFEASAYQATKGDAIYFDPPYWPLDEKSFTSYTSCGFDSLDHIRLADFIYKLRRRGTFVLLSNSDVVQVRNLYNDMHIIPVEAPRRINSNAKSRGLVSELLIRRRTDEDRKSK